VLPPGHPLMGLKVPISATLSIAMQIGTAASRGGRMCV
jgi:hypothetical protein